jgi:gliding motility-associated-like protein
MNGCSVRDSVQVKPKHKSCLIIPKAFTPNGDLINDEWNIGNIDLYPDARITIYNRWGQSVWRSEQGYAHPWDGKSNGTRLPIDAYHYIIDLHNGSKPEDGSITIVDEKK